MGGGEVIQGKVHYVHVPVDHFEEDCADLINAIGDQYVVRLIVTPSAYIHPTREELRGITLSVLPDTPVKRCYLRHTLGTGTSVYKIGSMSDGSEIMTERLHTRESKIAFNSCVSDACSEDRRFRIFDKSACNWEPELGADCVDEICVVREYQQMRRSYSWYITVTSGLGYAAEELLEYAEKERWTIQQLYRSPEYGRLMRAASLNRNRVAVSSAHALGVLLPSYGRERCLTLEPVDHCTPLYSSVHHTIVEKELENKVLLYAVHMDTFPLHACYHVPLRVPSLQIITVLEPDGEQGRASWKNQHANSFPATCGLKHFDDIHTTMSHWNPDTAYGDDKCSKHWASMVPYNLYNVDDAYKPWDKLQPGLQAMGLNNHWKQRVMEVVMIKTASMEEECLTAFELLRTVNTDGFIRVPIHCQVFRGGPKYRGLWHVYKNSDPPPAELLQKYTIPGVVYLHETYVRRIAYFNEEIPESELYVASSSSSSGGDDDDTSSTCGFSSDEEELDLEDAFD